MVHEIVVNLRIPPYKEKWFKEDDKISIDTCLLFTRFLRKNELRRTRLCGVANINTDVVILMKAFLSFFAWFFLWIIFDSGYKRKNKYKLGIYVEQK